MGDHVDNGIADADHVMAGVGHMDFLGWEAARPRKGPRAAAYFSKRLVITFFRDTSGRAPTWPMT